MSHFDDDETTAVDSSGSPQPSGKGRRADKPALPLRTEIGAPDIARAGLGATMAGRPDTGRRIAPPASGAVPLTGDGRTEIAPMRVPGEISLAPALAESQQESPATIGPGTSVRQFELIAELGRGGMGQVFRARDTKLGRLVAIKFLALAAPELVERFLVEARATARCQHENIVVIYEADEWNGTPFMVLEYLEGRPLSQVIEGATLSPRRAIEIMIPVLRALVRAHEFHIVHRDLKPDNIYLTDSGTVKVLDFGIAKLFGAETARARGVTAQPVNLSSPHTQAGHLIGTVPYMSPEQWGIGEVDALTDIWAVGIIFWELLTNSHPLGAITPERLMYSAASPEPMPSIASAIPDIDGGLEQIIDRCLAKQKAQRWQTAAELLAQLEALQPRGRSTLTAGESPYPGLVAFQESDASKFYGREGDIVELVQRLRSSPLVGLAGPSGVGKSSLIRAGVVPELRASGERWEILIIRPGSDPIAALCGLVERLVDSSLSVSAGTGASLKQRVLEEPGYVGSVLRERAQRKGSSILLFVDQFEELYTLALDPKVRLAFTAALSGIADDPSSPLRAVLSMRSDFIDRVAEDRVFMDRLTRGLMFLPPINRKGMREALTRPLESVGFAFESDRIVERMLNELESTPGALPLLQFTAAKLWDGRDRSRRLLTTGAFDDLGGVAGALASHADQVLARLQPAEQSLARGLFQRLVTSEGTRDVVELADLEGLTDDMPRLSGLVQRLADARLLTTHSDESGAKTIEIVHESLITSWPTLRRWLEESGEDAAFFAQLRQAAKQWEQRDRNTGLLWRGETAEEARRFRSRFRGQLAPREAAFLDAVHQMETRATRRKRRLVAGSVIVSLLIAAGAIAGLLVVRAAQARVEAQNDDLERAIRESQVARERAEKALAAQMAAEEEKSRAMAEKKEAQGQANALKDENLATKEQLREALEVARQSEAEARNALKVARVKEAEAKAALGRAKENERKAKAAQADLVTANRALIRKLKEENLSTNLK